MPAPTLFDAAPVAASGCEDNGEGHLRPAETPAAWLRPGDAVEYNGQACEVDHVTVAHGRPVTLRLLPIGAGGAPMVVELAADARLAAPRT